MFQKDLELLIKELRYDGFSQEESIKVVYFFKAWEILSEKTIYDKEFKFKSDIEELNIKRLQSIFKELSKKHYLFEIFNNNIKIDKLSKKSLILIFNFISDKRSFLKLYDMLGTILGKYGAYMVSNEIAELGIKLLNTNYTQLYAPFSTSFNVAYYSKEKVFAESQADELIIEIIKVVDNVDIEFHRTNVLEKPSFVEYNELKKFDCSVSFPPMGIRNKSSLFIDDIYYRFKIYEGKGSLDVAYFEHILSQTKRKAVVLMATGFTFRGGVEEKFRKYLIDENYLEAIIQLPPNLLIGTGVQTTFFVINKDKKYQDIYFMDLNDKQFIHKKSRQLILSNIDEIIEIYKERKEIKNIASIVSSLEIIENNYTFSINRYILPRIDGKIEEQLYKYELRKLEDVSSIRKSQLIKDEKEGVSIYEISPSDFKSFGVTLESGKVKKIKQEYRRYETYKLLPNDILLSTKGTVGKVALIGDIKEPMIASQAIQVIRLEQENIIYAKFLYMFLKSYIGQTLLKKLTTGSTMPQIRTKDIKELKIPIPSLEEQENRIRKFDEEVQLYKNIELLKEKINNINNNFLGDLSNE